MMKRPDDLLTNCYSVYLQIMPSSAKSEIYATVAYIQSLWVIVGLRHVTDKQSKMELFWLTMRKKSFNIKIDLGHEY